MNKIYTKAGDKGYTTNLLDKKYSKADIEIELQGELDEINSYIGFLRSVIDNSMVEDNEEAYNYVENTLKQIQYDLYLIGIEVSTEFSEVHIAIEAVRSLEKEIDYLVGITKPMECFIYYSGSTPSTLAHVARAITRRAERTFVRTVTNKDYPLSYQYINRLSDYFFVLSRFLNQIEGIADEPLTLK